MIRHQGHSLKFTAAIRPPAAVAPKRVTRGRRSRSSMKRLALLLPAPLLLYALPASATVSLTMVNGAATSATVAPGNSFAFTVKLTSSSTAAVDQVTAVDYFLTSQLASAPVSNIFTIASRNTQSDSSAFTDVYALDANVVTAGAGPGLNPTNGTDLGGSESNTNVPVSNATVIVADYSVSVNAAAPSGVYKVLTFSTPGTGYSGAGPTFTDHSFTSQGSFTANVVRAGETLWTGGTSTWGTAGNWLKAAVPVATDDAALGAGGPYTVTVSAASVAKNLNVYGNATLNFTGNQQLTLGGSLNLTSNNNPSLTLTGSGSVVMSSGTAVVGSAGGPAKLILSGGGLVTSATQINNGGQVILSLAASAASPNVFNAGALTFNGTGTLDVGNNELLTTTPQGTIRTNLISNAIFTSHTGTNTALGYGDGGGGLTEVRYTLKGDATLNGTVDVGDLGALATNYGATTGATWQQGDSNYDGQVNVADLGALATNYGTSLAAGSIASGTPVAQPTDLAATSTAVPEPASWLPALVGMAGVYTRRSRQRTLNQL
ncbi:MAG TPA: hypothetical protein VLI90_01715 [Tepidisphaeraceae bacterium]|nr:hypothetical protein [Tepidisphaeraceae bacterium]